MGRWIEADISLLQCEKCGHETAHLTFSGDTDMVTADLAALSSIASDEIVVVGLQADDHDTTLDRRINLALDRDDLRFVRLVRVEDSMPPAGTSFSEFRTAYQPPKLIFACPNCGDGEAIQVRTESLSEYEKRGGTLTMLADIELRDRIDRD